MTAATAIAAAHPAPRARSAANLWRLALADFRERTRRPDYLVALLVMAWLAHGMLPRADAGYRTFVMADTWRPAYGPEWVGTLVGVMTGLYFLLVGFYQVKGAVERDRRNGVGQVLAASRLSRRRYLAGKALSNFLVLSSMVVVAFGVALVTQQLLGEVRRFDPLATAVPLFLIALPVAAIVAGGAVLIESIPGLAGGFGNVVWFIASMTALSTGIIDSERGGGGGRDLLGVGAVSHGTYAALHAAHPDVPIQEKAISMGVNVSAEWKGRPIRTFEWKGLEWNAAAVGARAVWLLIAAAFVAAASLVFDRFERAPRARGGRASRPWTWFASARAARPGGVAIGSAAALSPAPRGRAFAGLVRAELALLLHGPPAVWFLGAAGMMIATVFAPLDAVRAGLLPVLSVWPVLLLGALGSRERQNGTEPLLYSAPRPVGRGLAAGWTAGALLFLALGAPALLRFALAGQWPWAAGWTLGAFFVPALALALGTWSGGPKFFEVLVLFGWYMGPMHHIAEVDYTGVTAPRSAALWAVYAALTAGLLAAAWLGRARRVHG